jgi:hypothetical protein
MNGDKKITVQVAAPSENENEMSLFWVDPWDEDMGHVQGPHIKWELDKDSRINWKIDDVTAPDGQQLKDAYPGVFGELHDYGDGGKMIWDRNKDAGVYHYNLCISTKNGSGSAPVASKDGKSAIDIDPTIRNGGND